METTLPEPRPKPRVTQRLSVRLAGVYQLQAVALQDALDLMFGMDGPGTGGVELHVGAPVLQRLARLAHLLVGQRDVVVRVSIGGRELNRGLIGVDGFLDASGFVEHVAQVEMGERVAWIDLDRRAVVLFGERVFLTVVIESAQIDVRRGVHGIHIENLHIDNDRLALRGGIFFQRDPTRKQVGNVGNHQFRPITRRAGHDFFVFGREIEHELSGDGLKQPPMVPKSDAASALIGPSLEQWILHAGNLLLHGFERAPDDGRTNALGAEVAHFLDLHKIEKRIIFAHRDQSRLLPGLKLARKEPKNAHQVGAAVAIHVCQTLCSDYPELVCGNASINAVEAVENQSKMALKWWSFLRRYLGSNAETYLPLGNHIEGRLGRSKLAGGEAGDLSGIMGVESTVRSDAGKGNFAGTSSRTIQRRGADPACRGG